MRHWRTTQNFPSEVREATGHWLDLAVHANVFFSLHGQLRTVLLDRHAELKKLWFVCTWRCTTYVGWQACRMTPNRLQYIYTILPQGIHLLVPSLCLSCVGSQTECTYQMYKCLCLARRLFLGWYQVCLCCILASFFLFSFFSFLGRVAQNTTMEKSEPVCMYVCVCVLHYIVPFR